MAERVVGVLRRYMSAVLILLNMPALLLAAAPEDPLVASSSKQSRDDATQAIPMAKLPRDAAAAVQAVLSDTSIYRRMPMQSIDCEPDLYLDLIKHPELIVNMWATMGITKMNMDRIGPNQYQITDGQGTKGTVRLVYSDENTHVVLSDGAYTGSMYPRAISGKCVLLLRSNYGQDHRGRMQIQNRLDMFLSIDNVGIEVFAKTFSTAVGKAADHNFAETVNFVSKLSKTSETNPDAVNRLVDKLNKVEPTVKQEFSTTVNQVGPKLTMAKNAYEQRALAAQQQPIANGNIQPVATMQPNTVQSTNQRVPLRPAQPAIPTMRR